VIEDEPAGRAEALGSQAGAATVAGEDEQVRAVGGGDLPLEPPAPLQPGARAGQALRRASGNSRPEAAVRRRP
jgi:hypothetical protein